VLHRTCLPRCRACGTQWILGRGLERLRTCGRGEAHLETGIPIGCTCYASHQSPKGESVRRSLAVGLLFAVLCSAVLAAPDLVVEEITTTPRAVFDRDPVRVSATVRNEGDTAVTAPFYVTFLVDGRTIDSPSVPGGLAAGGYVTVSAWWSALLGTHTLSAVADSPLNRVSESSEINNRESATIVVAADPEVGAYLATLKVAVAPFTDSLESGSVSLGVGIAEEVAARLVESGVRVIGWDELEHRLRELDMDPSSPADLATAARLLTADLLLTGEVLRLEITQASYGFGLAVNTATVDLSLSAVLLDVVTMEAASPVTASAREEGITGFSVDFLSLLGVLDLSVGADVCGGGLSVGAGTYDLAETVHLGYRNAGPSGWFDLEIATGRETFVRWLGSRFVKSGGCGEWLWDQQDGSELGVAPGLYLARLREAGEIIDEVGFWIQPAVEDASPSAEELTVGSGSFAESIVGRATDSAANQLASGLITQMVSLAEFADAGQGPGLRESAGVVVVEGQIAQLFADGRVAVNIGASHGVSKWDVLQVLDVANVVTDPSGVDLLSYDIVSTKGELIIVELGDLGSVAMKASAFDPEVGDVVRLLDY